MSRVATSQEGLPTASILAVAPAIAIGVLVVPVCCGLLATILPAFGYMPALGGQSVSLEPFRDLADRPGLVRSAGLSLATALVTTVVSVALVALFVAGWRGTRAFVALQHLLSPLLSIPHAAAAFGLAFLIAPSGYLIRLVSPWATGITRPPDWLILNDPLGLSMMAGLVLKEVPFLLLVTLAALPQTKAGPNDRLTQALGYGRMSGFLFVTWPLVYRQIRLAVFAVIAYASSVVDVSIILGPSTPSTLAVRLTEWMSDADLSLRFVGSAGALFQLAITVTALVIWLLIERIASILVKVARQAGWRFANDIALRLAVLALMAILAATVFVGLAVLALWSFAGFWAFPNVFPQNFSLANWNRAAPSLGTPMVNTLVVGVLSTALATVLALACLEREWRTGRTGGSRALWFIYLPLLVPQVSFVFGLKVFFLTIGWDATLAAMVLMHMVFVLPYVFLSLSDPWRAWDPRYGAVASGLGASPNRLFWRVRLPMLMKPALVALAVGFAVSVGQYLPTLLLGSGRIATITTEAVALSAGGDRRVIGVYAFLQMVLPFIAFALATAIPAFLFRGRRAMAGQG
ncbi:MAG: ABC transporter permease subunit [Pseudomonadota bacterium]